MQQAKRIRPPKLPSTFTDKLNLISCQKIYQALKGTLGAGRVHPKVMHITTAGTNEKVLREKEIHCAIVICGNPRGSNPRSKMMSMPNSMNCGP